MTSKAPLKRTDLTGQLSALCIIKKMMRFSKGQKLFEQGNPADCVFLIQRGVVKITIANEQGKEAVIAFLEAGDLSVKAASATDRLCG